MQLYIIIILMNMIIY